MSYHLFQRPKTKSIPSDAVIFEVVQDGITVKMARIADPKTKQIKEYPVVRNRMEVDKGNWSVKFKDANGVEKTKCLKTPMKTIAEKRARSLSNEAFEISEGLTTPDEIKIQKSRKVAILGKDGHLEAFEATMKADANTEKHVADTKGLITRAVSAIGAKFLGDITENNAKSAISTMKNRRGKPATVAAGKTDFLSHGRKNAVLRALKSFLYWAVKDKRLAINPLARTSQWVVEKDRKTVRRALLPDEMARLIEAAEIGQDYYITGKDRAMLYRLAFSTGLRKKELFSLTKSAFVFRETLPGVRVKATNSKNAKNAIQPLSPSIISILQPFVEAKEKATDLLFPDRPDNMADVIRYDLKIARQIWINEASTDAEKKKREQHDSFLKATNADGEKVDFHATRHTAITRAWDSGASPPTVQSFARHSKLELTLGYTHSELWDTARAVPTIPLAPDRPFKPSIAGARKPEEPPEAALPIAA